MATTTLLPVLTDTKDCGTIQFTDTTAAGYLTPFTASVATSGRLDLSYLDSSSPVSYELDNTEIDAIIAGGSKDITDFTTDGVMKGNYIVFFTIPTTTITLANASFTGTIANYDSSWQAPTYLRFNDGSNDYTLQVSAFNTGTGAFTLYEAYEGVSVAAAALEIGISAIFYHAHTCNTNSCIHKKIAELSLKSCGCKEQTTAKLNEALMVFFSIDIQMEDLNYKKAQDAISYLDRFCGGCGCGCS